MKKLLPLLLFAALLNSGLNAQCSATAPSAFMSCNYYGDYISAFSLNSIASTGNNGCGSSGYNLFTSPVRTLTMGNTYNWTATTGLWYQNGLGIWVDWNNDGQYVAAEMVAAKNYAFSHSGSFQVPYNAVVGTNIRMRVRCAEYYSFSSSTSPCNSLNGYGETEDYFLYITCPSSLPSLTVAPTSSLLCLGETTTLTASGAQNYTISGGSGNITNGVGFAPNASATYTITGGINACPGVTTSAVRTISVTSTPISVTASVNVPTICKTIATTLTATGASN
jgi:hypothetical protein